MNIRLQLVLRFLLVFGFVSSQRTGKKHTEAGGFQYSVTVPKSKLLSASNAVSSKEAVDEDFRNQLSAEMGWEHLLSPAPLSIGLLGDLMIMSTQTRDFPIDGQLPNRGSILYVKYPKSFRATLVQIANEGQRAFMVAHNNMDKIRLLTADVPGYMKEATGILVQGDEELVADYLPAPMFRIREAAKSSVILSKAVVWQFEHVMNLTAEVLEMCTSEKSLQEANLEKAVREQKTVNLTLTSFQQLVDQLNSSIARDVALMDRAEEDMRKALKDMPSGWEMIGMDFVQNVGDMLTSTLQSIGTVGGLLNGGNRAHSMGGSSVAAESTIQQLTGTSESALTTDIDWDPCIIQKRNSIIKLDTLVTELRNNYKQLASIDSSKGRYNPDSDKSKLDAIASDVEMCPPLAETVERGLLIVTELAQLARQQKPENITNEIFNKNRQTDLENIGKNAGLEFRKSVHKMKDFLMRYKQAIPNNTPLFSRGRQQANSKGLASQQALASCQNRADMAQATLLSTRQAMERTREQMIENNREVIKLLSEQQNLKLDEIRYDEIIKALEKGIEKLAILRQHWTQLVMFFQKIANIVETVAAKSIEDFANHIDTTSLKLRNIHKELVIDQLYAKAIKATQASSFVNNMATTYVNVSDKFIMPRVSSLSKLIVTDPKIAEVERRNLLGDCTKDSEAIIEMIVTEKESVIQRIEQRAAQIKKEYAFLDQVKERQIKELRRKVELEIDTEQTGRQISVNERQSRIEKVLVTRIEQDEFLRNNHILDADDDNDRSSMEIDPEEF
ncbi:uncharacterized protein LOC130690384 [Daphnia carinata]|uniref:uncharacterized protein LOC130690384 n=1 Tax=Daphnia carinata TaxID=120202 RepID=UPI00257EC1F3|nr:uncharacterized protein LOC130690384 [Daphnia carinata]